MNRAIIKQRLTGLEPGERRLLTWLMTDRAVLRNQFLRGLRKQFVTWSRDPQEYETPFSMRQWRGLLSNYVNHRAYLDQLKKLQGVKS